MLGQNKVVLPGAAVVDNQLLDEAIAEINKIHTSASLAKAVLIAQCIVKHFGGGDLDAFIAAGLGGRHASWRRLAKRSGELRVGYSYLWSAVQVLAQLRVMPEHVGKALSLSSHKRLLKIQDMQLRVALATRAVDEKLTVVEFEALLAKTLGKTQAPGRKFRDGL